MQTIRDLVEIPGVAPATLVLLKVTAVLLIALGLTALMRRTSATARHLVWVASLLAMLAVPALAWWSPVRFAVLPSALNSDVATGQRAPSAVRITADAVNAGAARVTAEALPSVSNGLPQAAPSDVQSTPSVTVLVLSAWALVAALLLAWLAYGQVMVRRIVRGATDLAGTAWEDAAIGIADRLGLDTLPRLVRSDVVTMPFACGLRHPVIVLPASCDAWSDQRRTAVLLHELAHVRRRDIVGHTLGRVTSALYWFHPLAWTAARRLRVESERACDDLALACGTRASDYAEHLLDIVTSVRNHATPSVAMAMATRSEFEGRMLAILDPALSRTAPTRLQASSLAGGVMMFAIVTGAMVPRQASGPVPALPGGDDAAPAAMAQDTGRREVRGTDTLTLTANPVGVAPIRGTLAPLAADPVSPVGPVRGEDPLAAIPSVARSTDSSARAAVLVRVLRTDSAASVRRIAAWGLNDFTDDASVVSALAAAVREDRSATVREMAAWALAYARRDDRAEGALVSAVRSDADAKVRETALWALVEGGNAQSAAGMSAVIAALGERSPELRELAAWGVGATSPRRAPDALIAALRDDDAHVRATVAWALHEIEDRAAVGALDAALARESDHDAKVAMVRAIGVLGDGAVSVMEKLVQSNDAEVRAVAIRALAGSHSDPWPRPRPRPRPFP